MPGSNHPKGRARWEVLKADGYSCVTCGSPYELEAINGHATCRTCDLKNRRKTS